MKQARLADTPIGKTFFQRTTSTLLALLLLVGGTACGTPPTTDPDDTSAAPVDTTAPAAETTAAPETTKYLDDLPDDIDLQQETIRIISRAQFRYCNEFATGEITGETINHALYKRNVMVEHRLNCKIQTDVIDSGNHGPVMDGIEPQLLSGTCEYDIIAGSMYLSMIHASNGYYLDLMEFSDIIDIEKPYWSRKFIEQAKINNKLFTLTGDAALTTRQSVFMTVFNKELVKSYQMENPYELVRSGKWTIDKQIEMTTDIYQDLNNNGKQDSEDMYGYSISNRVGVDVWMSALDLKMVDRDVDGKITMVLNKDKYFTAYDKVYKLYYGNGGTYPYPTHGSDDEMYDIMDIFANGQVIFAANWLRGLEQASVRNMKDAFGVLPNPKYDEAQPDYYSFIHDQLTVLSIPFTVSDDRAENIVAPFLEAMASESRETLIPQYYEVALKVKLIDAPDDAEMLDIISEGICVDFVWMCQGSDGYLKTLLREGIKRGTPNIASNLAAKLKLAEKSLEKFTAKFD